MAQERELQAINDRLKKLQNSQENRFFLFEDQIEQQTKEAEKSGKSISETTKEFQKKLVELTNSSKKDSLKDLKSNKKRIENLQSIIKETVSGSEQQLLEQQFSSVADNLKREISTRSNLIRTVTDKISQNFTDTTAVISGVVSDSPIVALSIKFLGDKFKELREQRIARKNKEKEDTELIKAQLKSEKEKHDSENSFRMDNADLQKKLTSEERNEEKNRRDDEMVSSIKEIPEAIKDIQIKEKKSLFDTLSTGIMGLGGGLFSGLNLSSLLIGGGVLGGLITFLNDDLRKWIDENITKNLKDSFSTAKTFLEKNVWIPFASLFDNVIKNFEKGFSFENVKESLVDFGLFTLRLQTNLGKLILDIGSWLTDIFGFEKLSESLATASNNFDMVEFASYLSKGVSKVFDFISNNVSETFGIIKKSFELSDEERRRIDQGNFIDYLSVNVGKAWKWIEEIFEFGPGFVKKQFNEFGKFVFGEDGLIGKIFDNIKQGINDLIGMAGFDPIFDIKKSSITPEQPKIYDSDLKRRLDIVNETIDNIIHKKGKVSTIPLPEQNKILDEARRSKQEILDEMNRVPTIVQTQNKLDKLDLSFLSPKERKILESRIKENKNLLTLGVHNSGRETRFFHSQEMEKRLRENAELKSPHSIVLPVVNSPTSNIVNAPTTVSNTFGIDTMDSDASSHIFNSKK